MSRMGFGSKDKKQLRPYKINEKLHLILNIELVTVKVADSTKNIAYVKRTLL